VNQPTAKEPKLLSQVKQAGHRLQVAAQSQRRRKVPCTEEGPGACSQRQLPPPPGPDPEGRGSGGDSLLESLEIHPSADSPVRLSILGFLAFPVLRG